MLDILKSCALQWQAVCRCPHVGDAHGYGRRGHAGCCGSGGRSELVIRVASWGMLTWQRQWVESNNRAEIRVTFRLAGCCLPSYQSPLTPSPSLGVPPPHHDQHTVRSSPVPRLVIFNESRRLPHQCPRGSLIDRGRYGGQAQIPPHAPTAGRLTGSRLRLSETGPSSCMPDMQRTL